jgi:HK97 family phage prohead protease
MNEPRVRAVPFQLTRAADGGDGLTLEGYAAVFNDTVRIYDPWDGEYDERFAKGAFRKTLRERTPYLMYQHGRHPLVGPLPIGTITDASEDDRGLRVTARLHDNWLVEPVRDAIASGSVSGMSIMFEPVKDTRDDSGDRPVITRTEVKLLELGPVVFPAYDNTEVGVRATCIEDLNDLRRVLTTKDVDGEAPDVPAEAPEAEVPATPDEAAPEGTSDEAGTPDPERSVPPEVVALLARLAARRYPPQGEAA